MTPKPPAAQAGAPVAPEEVAAINDRFVAEQETYNFCYRCESCVHNDDVRDRCSLSFRKEHFGEGHHHCRSDEGHLVFCKHFELGEE